MSLPSVFNKTGCRFGWFMTSKVINVSQIDARTDKYVLHMRAIFHNDVCVVVRWLFPVLWARAVYQFSCQFVAKVIPNAGLVLSIYNPYVSAVNYTVGS